MNASWLSVALSSGLALAPLPVLADPHYEAKNCEIFVDKVEASRGSHGAIVIKPFIKILPGRLDGAIAEVGFRRQLVYRFESSDQTVTRPWADEPLTSMSPVNDYWTSPHGLAVGTEYGYASYEGVFYVRTTAGTTFWARSSEGTNFTFDEYAWRDLQKLGGGSDPSHYWSVPTQQLAMRYYNPGGCY